MLDRIPPNKSSKVLVKISFEKISVAEKRHGLYKKKRKNGHKDVQSIENNGYIDAL